MPRSNLVRCFQFNLLLVGSVVGRLVVQTLFLFSLLLVALVCCGLLFVVFVVGLLVVGCLSCLLFVVGYLLFVASVVFKVCCWLCFMV